MYDSSRFNFINLSIKKSFDQPTLIKTQYDSLLEEANFIVSENNFKDKIIHIVVTKIIIDNHVLLEKISDNIQIQSLILEIKFICLNKAIINDISNIFKRNNLNVLSLYCSSYVKSIFYKKKMKLENNFIFLDIGFERTSALFFDGDKFQFLNSLPIGSNSITKDISKVLKLNIDYSEELKTKFNKYDNEITLNKNFPDDINLLKQIIVARVNEIIELTVLKINHFKTKNPIIKPSIIFIGEGSKLLPNILNIRSEKAFEEMIFYEENDSKIINAGINYLRSDQRFLSNNKKKQKKYGFFEKFFNLFSK